MRGPGRGARGAVLCTLTVCTGLLGVAALPVAPARAGVGCGTPAQLGDCTAPNTVITDEPPSSTASTSARFTAAVDPQEPGDTFECKLEGPAPAAHDWTDCTDAAPAAGSSTATKKYTGLPLGSYTFSVRASDHPDVGAPNVDGSPATYAWDVVASPPPPDTEPPDTWITRGAPRWLLFPFVRIRYAGDPDTTGFTCLLDGEPPKYCSYGQADLYGLKGRDYRFTVAASDEAGNIDSSPAVERWTVPINNTFLHDYSRGWKQKSGRGYFEDSYSITRRKGAFVRQGKRSFRALALVVTKCPGCGTVEVRLGSTLLERVHLDAGKRRQRQLVEIGSWLRPRSGTVEVRVTSSGKDVVLEGLGFSRHP